MVVARRDHHGAPPATWSKRGERGAGGTTGVAITGVRNDHRPEVLVRAAHLAEATLDLRAQLVGIGRIPGAGEVRGLDVARIHDIACSTAVIVSPALPWTTMLARRS